MSLCDKIEERVFGPFFVCNYGNNLLGKNIERLLRNDDPVKLTVLIRGQ